MTKERELLFTIIEQWGNAACDKEQLLQDFTMNRISDFFNWAYDIAFYDGSHELWEVFEGTRIEEFPDRFRFSTKELYKIFLIQTQNS